MTSADSFELLDKTELRIENIHLDGANLNDVAAAVSDVLMIDRDDVFVIDARDNLLTLDIMREQVDPNTLVGRGKELLSALGRVDGVTVTDETTFCSEGVLGWIVVDREEGLQAIKRSRTMAAEIKSMVARRVIVFSTGPEVISGQIEDTNTATIAQAMTAKGYRVTPGGALPDDLDVIAGKIREAILDRGFGTVITTGGVGAESKDKTVEALEQIDPDAATPYLAKFEMGKGRHVKDGIRIGVAEFRGATIVALPGPNDEVTVAISALLESLDGGFSKTETADAIAQVLRARMRKHHSDHHMHAQH